MINVRKRNGSLENLNVDKINVNVIRACDKLQDVSANLIVANAKVQLYEGVTTVEIDKALISSAKSLIEKDPNYSFVAARLLLNTIYKEVFQESVDCELFDSLYRTAFVDNIMFMVEAGILDKRLLDYDLDFLCTKLVPSRDLLFQYLGIKILSDRYLLRLNNKIMETPQAFWMRVCMGNCYNEGNKEDMVVKFYEKLSTLKLCPSTPTLFNSGSINNQLSSCFLSSLADDSHSIMQTMAQQAQLSKHAGGLGLDITPIRSAGSQLRGVDNIAAGIIPYIKIFNDELTGFNQQGKRQGSGVIYLEIWHKDIEDFLDIKDHTGDDRRRAHEINTSTWIVDLFMERVKADQEWYLFCPYECPELHLIHNDEFRKAYTARIDQAEKGQLKYWKKLKAKELWKKILTKRTETGNFWQCHKDISNYCNPNQHYAPIRQSNLCTEILEPSIPSTYTKMGDLQTLGETATCTLASANLVAHADENGKIDYNELADTCHFAIRWLDNCVTNQWLPTYEAQNGSNKHRYIGFGRMGFQDILHLQKISYNSPDAVDLSNKISEFISQYSILASSKLAKERGKYSTYEGSLWDQGIFPQDIHKEYMKKKKRSTYGFSESQSWSLVREHVRKYGMRNANLMAIAPTASIADVCGVEQSIEPNYSVITSKQGLSGENTLFNNYFVKEMKERGLWNSQVCQAIKQTDGDLRNLLIPDDLKERYSRCFEKDMFNLIRCCAVAQRWIDQGISFNIYSNKNSMKYLNDLYFYCWEQGLKTTYYLRTEPASKVKKVTINTLEQSTCSIEAMKRGESCESCQ